MTLKVTLQNQSKRRTTIVRVFLLLLDGAVQLPVIAVHVFGHVAVDGHANTVALK